MVDAKEITFEAGQVWKYKTRSNELDSRLIILKVEQYENSEEVIHIAVVGLSMKNVHDPSWLGDDISHMPFNREALVKCVVSFDKMIEVPDFSEGYEIWKEAFDKGEAGIYSVSVSETVDIMEATINEGY